MIINPDRLLVLPEAGTKNDKIKAIGTNKGPVYAEEDKEELVRLGSGKPKPKDYIYTHAAMRSFWKKRNKKY